MACGQDQKFSHNFSVEVRESSGGRLSAYMRSERRDRLPERDDRHWVVIVWN